MSIDHEKNVIEDKALDDLAAGAAEVQEKRPQLPKYASFNDINKFIKEAEAWQKSHPDDKVG